MAQPRWMLVRGILGSGRSRGVSFRPLLVGGGLLVPCSLSGPPVIKQLMQTVTESLPRVGSFSQCASPKNSVIAWKPWASITREDTGHTASLGQDPNSEFQVQFM